MGQIVSNKAKPKRCNINQLSQLGTPAAGEHILVSSDNSMNAAGQGNFDCYIVGNGTTAAAALELKNVEPLIGVFDISSYHATGGVLAKYADLTAALDGGNNIPQSFRKGGMSVKFVQSSDNNYVQFRLMSDSFNTTPANWQGVDDEPTAGSDNLVKSGGVADVIENIYTDRVVPDVFTFTGNGAYISFNPITIAEDGDAIEIEVQTAINSPYGMAFSRQNGGGRSIGIGCSIISINSMTGALSGMDGSSGQYNIYTNEGISLDTAKHLVKIAREGNNIKLYIDGLLIKTVAVTTEVIQLANVGGPEGSTYWSGTLYGFRYIHNGNTTQIYDLSGFTINGALSYTTKTLEMGKLNELGREFEALKDKTLSDSQHTTTIPALGIAGIVPLVGYNATDANLTTIKFNQLSGYDSYYYYLDKDCKLWTTDANITYVSICIVENAGTFDNNQISGTSAYRVRKLDNNMPTEANPLILSQGTAVVFTVTSGNISNLIVHTTTDIETFNGETPLAQEHVEQVLNSIVDTNKRAFLEYVGQTQGLITEYVNIYMPCACGYVKYIFGHYVDATYKVDVWQVINAVSTNENKVEIDAITTSGEWELAISPRIDNHFVCGRSHGNEVLTNIMWVIDGVVLTDISTLNGIVKFTELKIIRESTIYDPDNTDNDLAEHGCEYTFNSDGLKINQSVKWLVSLLIVKAYMAMFPVAQSASDKYFTDVDYSVNNIPAGGASHIVVVGSSRLNIWKQSKAIYSVFGIDKDPELVNPSELLMHNNGGTEYNKCYYYSAFNNTPSINDIWHSTTVYNIMCGKYY